jgi:hypothetical protein
MIPVPNYLSAYYSYYTLYGIYIYMCVCVYICAYDVYKFAVA